MPVINRFADLHHEIAGWRRDIHEHPELLYDVHRTAGLVADRLKDFGVDEIVTGIGRTGVVGVIKGSNDTSGKVIGMRADMDALPIMEETGQDWASKTPGVMHACGHDGHTAMLLGAAKYLSETRRFDGTVVVIFQPAEEGGAGGKAMVDDGMMDRFGIQEVYGMHNMPGLPVGQFAIRPGPMMASADLIEIEIDGLGGHAARPHECVDTVVVASHIIQGLQTITSRNVNPLESAVVSVTMMQAGNAFNVIPPRASLKGTVRTLKAEVRDLVEKRISDMVERLAGAFGARATVTYKRMYPVTSNHEVQTGTAVEIAREVSGTASVNDDAPPVMGGEDFSFMLNARPGAFIFMGNGNTAGVHHPEYDFNDEAIPVGCSYWANLAEKRMPL